jgi:hypothetical protein
VGSFRFYRRVNIFPGLSVNFSKSGPSLTVGMRGAHVTLGNRGITRTVGLPGTGIYYTSRSGFQSGVHSAHRETQTEEPSPAGSKGAGGLVTLAIIVAIALAIGVAIGKASGVH